MRKYFLVLLLALLTTSLTACSKQTSLATIPVSPALDKLTFLFFYTDN